LARFRQVSPWSTPCDNAEAQALAEALSNYDDIDQALAVYNAARQSLTERIVSHARKLGMQLGVGIVTDEDRKFAKLIQSPEPNFLAAHPNL
jgi:hypothetical protein